jgi:uncharacterized membrane protein (DUF4010 family)
MPKNFMDFIQADSIFTMAWVVVLSMLGGIAGYIRKLKQGMTKRFSVTELIGEMVVSAFVGIVTFFLCKSSGFEETLTAAIVGLSSHMGSRAIYIIEVLVRKKIGINIDDRCSTCEVMTGIQLRNRRSGE